MRSVAAKIFNHSVAPAPTCLVKVESAISALDRVYRTLA